MTENWQPLGEERNIQTLDAASVDGTPVAYIVVLAAVVTVLAFIPFSFVLATGGSMPLSQAIFPLLGWLLGPIAGALAAGIGSTIGVFLAPYTAGLPLFTIFGAVLTSFVAGLMVIGRNRRYWWLVLTAIFSLQLYLYASHALQNGVSLPVIIAGSFVDWSALLLFLLPTRTLFARWINSKNFSLVALGVFFGTWMTSGVTHLSMTTITYYMFNWPEQVWITLIPIIPVENLIRCLAGTVIGTGVISGLRSINLVKPREAIY